jgi:hypothetical protein
MERLLAQSVDTNKSLQETVGRLSQATDTAVTGMNEGAQTLYIAATEFASSGDKVGAIATTAAAASADLKGASASVATAAAAIRDVTIDYSRTRDAFGAMVLEFKSVAEMAKREASLTTEIIGKMASAATQLKAAQTQSEEYLKGVTEVLVKAHQSFSECLEGTLRDGNRQFQGELREAVNVLSAAIKDLGDTLDDLPRR